MYFCLALIYSFLSSIRQQVLIKMWFKDIEFIKMAIISHSRKNTVKKCPVSGRMCHLKFFVTETEIANRDKDLDNMPH